MMKKLFVLIVPLFLSMCICTMPLAALAVATDAVVQSIEQQLADLDEKKQETLSALDSVREDLKNAQATKEYYDTLISISIKRQLLAQQQLEAIAQQIAEKETAIAEAQENIRKQEAAFSDRMVTLYEEGDVSYLELLLGTKTLAEFFTQLDNVRTIQEYDRQVVASLETSKQQLLDAQTALKHSQELQQNAIEILENEILSARAYADQSIVHMEALQNDEAALLEQHYKNQEAEKALDAELTAYLAELAAKEAAEREAALQNGGGGNDSNSAAYATGTLAFPLPNDVWYRVSSEYGWRTLDGVPDEHRGIDLACVVNTHIYAADGGTVVTSTEHWSYGNYVIIDHGNGVSTLYAHMNQRAVVVGQKVSKGELIGYVGTTGYSKGYHLHFEVRINGKHTQPRDYISLP